MPFDGNPAWGDQVDGDSPWAEFAGPGAREAKLRALGGDITGEGGVADLEDFRSDLNDSAELSRLHASKNAFGEQERALYKEFKLIETYTPIHFLNGQHGLRTGGVDHQDVDRTETFGDSADQPLDLSFVADICAERLSYSAGFLDLIDELVRLIGACEEV